MRINHNIAAFNTYRQLSTNASLGNKSLEKLSSGYRINRAGDDAAGLAISEKMRAQIRGLDQATRNAQDGISMVQTAEGALSETQSILQRMREIADQSANGTLTSDDRDALQDEITQLKSEIDRIGNATEFNTKKLLNGALAGTGGDEAVSLSSAAVFRGTKGSLTGVSMACDATTICYAEVDALMVDGNKIDIAWSKYLTDDDKTIMESNFGTTPMTDSESHAIRDILERVINQAIDDSGTGAQHINVTDATSKIFKIESATKGNTSEIELYMGDGAALTAKTADGTQALGTKSVFDLFIGSAAEMAGNVTTTNGDWYTTVAVAANACFNVEYNGQEFAVSLTGTASGCALSVLAADIQTQINTAVTAQNTAAGAVSGDDNFLEAVVATVTDDGRISIQADSGDFTFGERANQTVVEDQGFDLASAEASGLGAVSFQIGANKGQTMALSISDMRSSALGISGIDVSSAAGASAAIDTVDSALKSVSSTRSKLGAVQNRLEHTINNLGASQENLTAAESRIRDVDMAKEMMEFTKNNILTQAAQAMLAQANQQPQGVLQLLR